jgi:hypothetical protein
VLWDDPRARPSNRLGLLSISRLQSLSRLHATISEYGAANRATLGIAMAHPVGSFGFVVIISSQCTLHPD